MLANLLSKSNLSIFSNNSIKGFLSIFSGSVGAQLVGFLLVPIVARIFNPSDYGIAALVLSIVYLVLPISSLRYDQSIFLPENDRNATALLNLSFIINICVFLLLILVCGLFFYFFQRISYVNTLGIWIWAIPPLVLVSGLGDSLQSLNLRYSNYKTVVLSETSRTLLTPLTRILFGLVWGSTVFGLVFGFLMAISTRLIFLFHPARKRISAPTLTDDKKKYVDLALQYRDFPLLNLPNDMLLALNKNIPVLILGSFSISNIIGIFAMAERLIRLPLGLVVDSLRKVLTPTFSQKVASGEKIYRLFILTTTFLAVSGIIPLLILYFWGEPLISFFLGYKWTPVAKFAAALIPILFMEYIQAPASVVFMVLRKQDVKMKLQIIRLVSATCSLAAGYWATKSVFATILIYSIVGCVSYIPFIFIGSRLAYNWDRSI